jgi:hypothetical protein
MGEVLLRWWLERRKRGGGGAWEDRSWGVGDATWTGRRRHMGPTSQCVVPDSPHAIELDKGRA